MVYKELARNGNSSLLVTNNEDKIGIIINRITKETWRDISVIATLNKVGWVIVADTDIKKFNIA